MKTALLFIMGVLVLIFSNVSAQSPYTIKDIIMIGMFYLMVIILMGLPVVLEFIELWRLNG